MNYNLIFQFVADVMRPLKMDALMDQEVQNLSGGELQRVAMTLCLGKPADVYLIDEPSAYLDSEQRLACAKVRIIDVSCIQHYIFKQFFNVLYLYITTSLLCFQVIKRFILHAKKTGFVVEHDFIMATYLADRVIVFDGEPSVKTMAHSPQSMLAGMNKFLEQLSVTFRRDPNNYR